MQFKIDENLPIEIAELLNDAGHDAITVNNQQLQGARDHLLINVCKSEHRALITLDTDFSDIRAYAPEEFSGIIVLRVRVHSKSHIIKVLRSILPLFNREPLTRHLWIVEETKVRVRSKGNEV